RCAAANAEDLLLGVEQPGFAIEHELAMERREQDAEAEHDDARERSPQRAGRERQIELDTRVRASANLHGSEPVEHTLSVPDLPPRRRRAEARHRRTPL